jgi:8-hydroxy-5-deazaflavin:NADPH oxidoreductase
MIIAFIGGTGPEGKGLAYRLAVAGLEIIIGSRSAERAADAAKEIAERAGVSNLRGAENIDAAREGEIIVLTVPFDAQAATLPPLADALNNKIIVSTGVPLVFDGGKPGIASVPEGSAAEQAQALLAGSRVVGAFHNLSANKLWAGGALDQDVLVAGNEDEAKNDVMALAEQIEGIRAVDGGALAASRLIEGITALLIGINKRYKTAAGVRIVGV